MTSSSSVTLSGCRPSSASRRNTQLSITSNNSTYQSPRLSPETWGLMPRQRHSSWGGVTAGAWGSGTRQSPEGLDWASVTQPSLGVQVRGMGIGMCYNSHYSFVNKKTWVCSHMCRISKKKIESRSLLLRCVSGHRITILEFFFPQVSILSPSGLVGSHCLIVLCPLTSFLFNGLHVEVGEGQ